MHLAAGFSQWGTDRLELERVPESDPSPTEAHGDEPAVGAQRTRLPPKPSEEIFGSSVKANCRASPRRPVRSQAIAVPSWLTV